MSASLDGFLAQAPGVIDWLTPPGDPTGAGAARHTANLELLDRAREIVIGRGAYDEMAEVWSRTDSPMGRVMNETPKLLLSQSEPAFAWANARRSDRPLDEEIAASKQAGEGDVVCIGGARLAHALARGRLIDEYRLTVHPVALGAGLSLWHGLPEPQRYAPVAATLHPDGAVTHVLAAQR
jgi:dihydrofolate reductase